MPRWLRVFAAGFVALLVSGLCGPAASAVETGRAIHAAYVYNSHHHAFDRGDTAAERGPPRLVYEYAAPPRAVDSPSYGASASLHPAAKTLNHLRHRAARAVPRRQRDGLDGA